MTNKEHFKEEIFEIACEGDSIAVDKRTNKPCGCGGIGCSGCALANKIGSCRDALVKWLDEEYKEPCPFEKDELVEVSYNGKNWCLRYFSHKDNNEYCVFPMGAKSSEKFETVYYQYCRKYGTLGGLVKGEQND